LPFLNAQSGNPGGLRRTDQQQWLPLMHKVATLTASSAPSLISVNNY